ncbi:hypothetical protein ABBQ38_004415 [Trebouxia sp. C0009 RCD-2024]
MRSLLRLLLNTAVQSASGVSDTVTKNVPTAAPASSSSSKSATSVFIIYMAIGFSVTFASILALMVVYHCCRRNCPPLVVVGARPAETRRRSSSQGSQCSYELKQLFVVQHPGGSANIAFREDEEPQPYKKKNRAVLLSASLDDACFTIPAHKATVCDPVNSQALTPEHELQQREDCTSSMPTDDGASDILTESMLSASSDIILADDLEDFSQLESQISPSRSHAAGHCCTSDIAEV